MRTSAATVCLSGSLVEKLHACAAAGFDGVEIFEPDLVASESGPEEIRALAKRLGLSLDLYQPFRDFEGVTPELLADNLRRAEAKFALMQRLGIETILVCSNVGTATVDSDQTSADQLRASVSSQRTTACGSRSKPWPGVGSSTITGARGESSSAPTTRGSGSAWTASISCPEATIQPASSRSRARRSSTSSWPTLPH